MTSQPLTADQLATIQARADAATDGPWQANTRIGVVTNQADDPLAVFGGSAQDRADAEFTAHAREDVPALLAEIQRLKTQRKYLITQLAQRDAETGRGDKALAEFLNGDTTEETGQ
jgi:nicotinamide mononucleotide adenylyltransferase